MVTPLSLFTKVGLCFIEARAFVYWKRKSNEFGFDIKLKVVLKLLVASIEMIK